MENETVTTAPPENVDLTIDGVDLGNVAGVEAAEDTDYPVLPASPFHYEKNEAGESVKKYDVVYGFELARHAEVRRGKGFRANENVFALRAKALSAAPETDFYPSIFEEFGRFPSEAEVRARIMADAKVAADEKDTKIRKALRGLQFEKARMVSMAKALAPLTLNDLKTRGQGLIIGAALDVKVRPNGSQQNIPVKWFPATAITQVSEVGGVDVAGLDTPDDDVAF